jgi:hypothetical protein
MPKMQKRQSRRHNNVNTKNKINKSLKKGASIRSMLKTHRAKTYSSVYGHTENGNMRENRNLFL